MEKLQEPNLTLARNLKISVFHLGSGMVDVLTTGVWNRIMVADLGYGAAIIGLLTGLRYFLAPIGIWVGRYSDTKSVGGYHRLLWIWLGRAMMALSTVSLGFSTAELINIAQSGVTGQAPFGLWIVLIVSFLLFSLGNALSGSTFLALVYDRSAEHQRGRAVGLVWTFLLLGFTIGGVFFSVMLPHDDSAIVGNIGYTAESVQTLFLVTACILGLVWFLSLLGEEKRGSSIVAQQPANTTSLRHDLSLVWRSRSMRFFLFYLVLSMMFAFLQDTVLEPFAGQVFDMEASTTNRFSAYWGSMAILGSFGFLFLSRRYPILTNSKMSQGGIFFLILAYLVFTASSLAEIRGLVTPGLILLGIGLGFWNIGTLGLMMDLSPIGRAGTFLGFWTLCVTIARGLGVSVGGIIRDIVLGLTGEFTTAYGVVFVLGFIGLGLAWLALLQVNIKDYKSDIASESDLATLLSGAMD